MPVVVEVAKPSSKKRKAKWWDRLHDTVYSLCERSLSGLGPPAWQGDEVMKTIEAPDTLILCASAPSAPGAEGAGMAGCAVCEYSEECKTLFVVYLCVAARHRRSGVGSALMASVEHLARALDCGSLELMCNSDNGAAMSFYAKLGMTAGDPDLADRVLFTKELL